MDWKDMGNRREDFLSKLIDYMWEWIWEIKNNMIEDCLNWYLSPLRFLESRKTERETCPIRLFFYKSFNSSSYLLSDCDWVGFWSFSECYFTYWILRYFFNYSGKVGQRFFFFFLKFQNVTVWHLVTLRLTFLFGMSRIVVGTESELPATQR